ncbi:hypothetical protein F7Q92_02285 [Ideonella dechloratans]|uniref:Calcineurin-like phosphoesterase domain-containing protein n=1 Tax=Ideonella dechloratans TaxID=36863 RepID=A0A643FG52_IDEDE|nr:metallophosphoesterase [Ideonella dechloratans]KAB0584681.1 hypothetical protein F7Q92_02285 [Ideonella dechloratans]UFU12315.1 metallophosphoesterase [Ideonella dechloratans]
MIRQIAPWTLTVRTAALALAAALAGCGGSSSDPTSMTLAVIGDMPYGASPTDTAEFDATPDFINAINADKDVSMVMHAGDIHSGKQYCTQDYDLSIAQQWSAFRVPLVYTPGDNEWADCHKKKEGGGEYSSSTGDIVYVQNNGALASYAGGDPVANLGLVRSIFFAAPGQTLGKAMTVHSQATEYDPAHPTDSAFVENVWFEQQHVLFATANMPGGSNNGTAIWYKTPTMSPAQSLEVANRTGATLRWLQTAFAQAKAHNDAALVLMIQADMWDLDGNTLADGTLTEYKQYIDLIASLAADFGKPVLLINGDSHFYRSDNPLVKGADCHVEVPSSPIGARSVQTTTCADSVAHGALNGITDVADPYLIVEDAGNAGYVPSYAVPNFHRVVVHGNATASNTDKEYLKLTIDTSVDAPASENAFGPFAWTRVQP